MTFLYKCAKEQYISRSREDEKRDEVMGIFRRIFGKSDELVYGSSENPRPLRRVDAVEEDLRTTMEHFLELKETVFAPALRRRKQSSLRLRPVGKTAKRSSMIFF